MGLSGQPRQPLHGALPSGRWAPQAPSMPSVLSARPNSTALAPSLQVLRAILGGAWTVQPLGLGVLSEFPRRKALAAPAAVHYLGTPVGICARSHGGM